MSMDVLMADLVEAIQRLAQDAAEQERWLRDDGAWPSLDELVLTFDDVQGAAAALATDHFMSVDAAAEVARVAAQVHEMSGDSDIWEGEALRSEPAWEELRRLAARALAAIEPVRA
jgi:hypothetical protein